MERLVLIFLEAASQHFCHGPVILGCLSKSTRVYSLSARSTIEWVAERTLYMLPSCSTQSQRFTLNTAERQKSPRWKGAGFQKQHFDWYITLVLLGTFCEKNYRFFFSPLEEGKASTLCPASERLIILIVFRQFAVEWKQFWVSQVKQLLCVKLRLRARPLCLDEMSTAGLRYVAPGPFVCSCPHWSKINCEAQRTAVVGDFRVAPHRPVSPRARYNNLKQPQPCGHAFALKIRQTEPPKS